MKNIPTMKPMMGPRTMNRMIACHLPGQISTPVPALVTAAPAMPATSACELLVGRPSSQVMMFQMIAPINPPKTTQTSTKCGSTSPAEIVSETLVPKTNAATKLKNAAHTTACVGESTRVETTVAMELAAS